MIEAYRQDRRTLEIPGYLREDLGSVVRYTPLRPDAEGIVCLTNLGAHGLDAEIQRHIAHFRAAAVGFEWKVYDSDEPRRLKSRLLDLGFVEGEPESVMVFQVSEFRPRANEGTGAVEVRRIQDVTMLRTLVDLQERVWARSFPWLYDQLRAIWDRAAFFGAFQHGEVIGTGWIEYPTESRFAEIHGGAVLPELRGQGVYSSLFERRMADALHRGVEWVAVDAAPMSRPILAAKGFEELDRTYPLTWAPESSSAFSR